MIEEGEDVAQGNYVFRVFVGKLFARSKEKTVEGAGERANLAFCATYSGERQDVKMFLFTEPQTLSRTVGTFCFAFPGRRDSLSW
jgi:hypothetical protein